MFPLGRHQQRHHHHHCPHVPPVTAAQERRDTRRKFLTRGGRGGLGGGRVLARRGPIRIRMGLPVQVAWTRTVPYSRVTRVRSRVYGSTRCGNYRWRAWVRATESVIVPFILASLMCMLRGAWCVARTHEMSPAYRTTSRHACDTGPPLSRVHRS